ncbi:Golgi membrane exchange factor (Ric1p-Rgp1p) subunit [Vanrija albida]|uniref:Golgi membrane exchange factor (Ric1p-Rgp1p) subunit n=1 Tax=Vanrija albida TaxID=181172 RepID=A0ABR3PS75_9TREE
MFSIASPTTAAFDPEDPHLEVIVTPSASAFYAGETFSAVITLRNTRIPIHTAAPNVADTTDGVSATGLDLLSGAKAPSSTISLNSPASAVTPTIASPDLSSSPGGSIWRGEHTRRSSLNKHTRRSQSLALGKGVISPQEMVWALGGAGEPSSRSPEPADDTPPSPLPPALPARRSPGIPVSHPHARKISVASTAFMASPEPDMGRFATPPPTAGITDGDGAGPRSDVSAPPTPQTPTIAVDDASALAEVAGPSRNGSSRVSPSPSPSLPDVAEEPHVPNRQRLRIVPPPPNGRVPSPTSSASDAGSDSAGRRPLSARRVHSRSPTYHEPGGLLSPPPQHPSARLRPPVQIGVTNVLWGYTRLVARFAPSHQHIPPDPLLPLRAKLLHQPIGSGSLTSSDASRPAGSRWTLNFGTGTIGQATQPSLTGSLFGLAKGLVLGGAGGSLEEERKRVWNTQDLPVLETTRSLMGVDIKLAEGESRDFVYTLPLPVNLPPAFKGKAIRFSYDLVVSLNVALPGGRKQRAKEITIPIRVWPHVTLGQPLRAYDVLQPVIQNTETGTVVEQQRATSSVPRAIRPEIVHEPPRQKADSLGAYAQRLLRTLEPTADGVPRVPPSPSKAFSPLEPLSPTRGPGLKSPGLPRTPSNSHFLLAPNASPMSQRRARATSFVAGDDELVEEGQRSGEAVEILSRHSPKASYDIRQEGEVVAVLTLIKTTYRLGETVLGVVTFNNESNRRVLKCSAFLETHEVVPESLLPPSASHAGKARSPELRRMHADSQSGYALHTSRISFTLDIPSDATPAFGVAAGGEGRPGGVEWRVRLAFLVSSPPSPKGNGHARRSSVGGRKSADARRSSSPEKRKSEDKRRPATSSISLLPVATGDGDNQPFVASAGLAPLFAPGGTTNPELWAETRAETVECEVPVQVLAGSTAFVVRPSVYTV